MPKIRLTKIKSNSSPLTVQTVVSITPPQASPCGGPRRSEAPQKSSILNFFWTGFLFPDRIKYFERSVSDLTNTLEGPRLPSRSGRGRHGIEASVFGFY